MTNSALGELLKKQRKSLKYTQAYVAKQIGVSTRSYQRLEVGASLDNYEKAFDVLGIKVVVLPKDSLI